MAVLFQSRFQLQICLLWFRRVALTVSSSPIINSLREHGLLDENDDSQVPLVGWLYLF